MGKKYVFNKKVALLLIQIIVVAVVLVLTVGTYAWYTSQDHVEVTQTTVTAAAGANTTITDIEDDTPIEQYSGQTGTGFTGGVDFLDVPYVYNKRVLASFEPTQANAGLTIKLTSVKVKRVNPTEEEDSATDPAMLGYFTWRATARQVADATSDDPAVRYAGPAVNLKPETAPRTITEEVGGVETERIVDYISSDHAIIDGGANDGEWYTVTEGTVTEIAFELIFLDENSYLARLDVATNPSRKNDLRDFAYSGYKNMRAVFTCTLEIGFDY